MTGSKVERRSAEGAQSPVSSDAAGDAAGDAVRDSAARRAVRRELASAVLSAAATPFRAAAFLVSRGAAQRELVRDLGAPAAIDPTPTTPELPRRPLSLLVSCAEVSGETHAANLVRALRRRAREAGAPEPRFCGLGGSKLSELGVDVLGDPVSRADMGLSVARSLPFYTELLERCARALGERAVDACVPVDSPALHVPLGRLARKAGVPVVHFVTPQLWGWAPWRAARYRTAVDRALAILPFEPPWFARRGVPCAYVGHPLLDELEHVEPRAPSDAPRGGPLVLLPGSRQSVVRENLPWMLAVLERLRARTPGLEAVLPKSSPELDTTIKACLLAAGAERTVRVVDGDLHGALRSADAALSVSGTVLLDLLWHRLPAVVIYRLGSAREAFLLRRLLTTPWFASVNLLAGAEVYPELGFHGAGPLDLAREKLELCLQDAGWRARCREGLDRAAARLGPPGATDRAAAWTLDAAVGPRP